LNSRVAGIYRRGSVWWISYYQHGHRIREPVGKSYRDAVKVRMQRVADIESGRLGLRPRRKAPTLRAFVEEPWRADAVHLKPSTLVHCPESIDT